MKRAPETHAGPNRRTFMTGALSAPALVACANTAHADRSPDQPSETRFTRTNQMPAGDIYISHAYEEFSVDLGEVTMNFARAGDASKPALLLIPGQTESWWGFEKAMALLAPDFEVFAVDLRGQGRSTRTPGRYTLDNMGNDLVRFIQTVIQRPVITSGCSSGGLLSCWLSAYAPPELVRASHYEDAPFFASELTPKYGPTIRQAAGPFFFLMSRYLGDQWSVGDWEGYEKAMASLRGAFPPASDKETGPIPQNIKEYDPEWARAFYEGTVAQSCRHDTMLQHVKVPALFTHHARRVDPKTGNLMGATTDLQAEKVKELVTGAGQALTYVSLPDAAHAMHLADPPRFNTVLREWIAKL